MRSPILAARLSVACAAALLVTVATAAASAAPATDQAAVKKVTDLNRKALDAYQNQDYTQARSLLKEALDVCVSSGLDQHPIKARTHIHMGVVLVVGFKQRDVGLKQFRKALEIQPDIKLTKSLATPELQDAFEEAVLAAENGGGKEGGAGGEEGGAPSVQAEDGGAEAGAKRAKAPPRRRPGGDEDEGEGNAAAGAQTGSFFLGLALGSGFGVASGSGELDPSHKLSSAGFALAQAGHVAPEIGYFVTPALLLSAQLRYQYVVGVNGKSGAGCGSDGFCQPSNYAVAVLAKGTFLLLDGPFHVYAGGEIGGGNIRHAVNFSADPTCRTSATGQMQTCVDTLAGGPFLIGPTFGIYYELGSTAAIIAGLNTELGVPHFTFNFDVNVGVGFRI